MREIKFRAWNPDNPNPSQRMVNNPLYRCDPDGVLEKKGIYKNWILLQYTGLKDKNGKEIFEGDIVKHPYNPDEVIEISLDPYQIHQRVEFGEWNRLSASEIIGNIYENPDILPETHKNN